MLPKKNGHVSVDVATHTHATAEAGHIADLLLGADRDVGPELRTFAPDSGFLLSNDGWCDE